MKNSQFYLADLFHELLILLGTAIFGDSISNESMKKEQYITVNNS